ncbi:MAG: type II toxin-antitoxin system RelE/ParE family toxin [Candidatus Acidiferrales bacterium]
MAIDSFVDAIPRIIRIYQTAEGEKPFADWMAGLQSQRIHGIVLNRMDRVRRGNFGDHRSVGEGVFEIRIDFGPGYRVYYGLDGERQEFVVLLVGGSKGNQSADIAAAQSFWRDYNA